MTGFVLARAAAGDAGVVLAMVAGMGVWWRLCVTGKANR